MADRASNSADDMGESDSAHPRPGQTKRVRTFGQNQHAPECTWIHRADVLCQEIVQRRDERFGYQHLVECTWLHRPESPCDEVVARQRELWGRDHLPDCSWLHRVEVGCSSETQRSKPERDDFAFAALGKVSMSAIGAMFSLFATFVLMGIVALGGGEQFISGFVLLGIVGIFALVFVVYFAFLFGRRMVIKMRTSGQEREFEIDTGDDAR